MPKIKTFIGALIILIFLSILVSSWTTQYKNEYTVGDVFIGLPGYHNDYPKSYFGKSIDVDKDSKEELVFYTSDYMTKSPHNAYIVKNNKILFKYNGARVNIVDTEDQTQGFTLTEMFVDASKEGTKKIKYLYLNEGITKTIEEVE